MDSCSSFSLQECIDEFRARRIRRVSTQSREVPEHKEQQHKKHISDPAELDLINQNRSNKEQERKCKPCENGFCYCFTSDSGDGAEGYCRSSHGNQFSGGGNVAAARARRSRKSEISHVSGF